MLMVRVMSNLFCTLLSCCGDQDTIAPLDPVRSASANMTKEHKKLSARDKAKSRQCLQKEQTKLAKEELVNSFETKTTSRSYDKPVHHKPSLRRHAKDDDETP